MVPPYDFYRKMTYIYTSRKGIDHNAKFFGASRYGKAGYNAKLETFCVMLTPAKKKSRQIEKSIWKTMTHQIELSGPLVDVCISVKIAYRHCFRLDQQCYKIILLCMKPHHQIQLLLNYL
jgi:hypothetical protein